MKQIPSILLIFLFPSLAAQTTISGSVKNLKGEPIIANVLVQAKGSASIAGFTTTTADGVFSMTYRGDTDSITLTVTGMNVGRHSKTVANESMQVDFQIDEKPLVLSDVNIAPQKIRQFGDTINYNVDEYRDQSDRVIGDVLKKLPGIEVSPLGQISYRGQGVNKFYIEGMDLMQGRYGIAVRNIPAEDIASVEVLENHQPIRTLRNRVFSDRAAINLRLKESVKGTHSVTGIAG